MNSEGPSTVRQPNRAGPLIALPVIAALAINPNWKLEIRRVRPREGGGPRGRRVAPLRPRRRRTPVRGNGAHARASRTVRPAARSDRSASSPRSAHAPPVEPLRDRDRDDRGGGDPASAVAPAGNPGVFRARAVGRSGHVAPSAAAGPERRPLRAHHRAAGDRNRLRARTGPGIRRPGFSGGRDSPARGADVGTFSDLLGTHHGRCNDPLAPGVGSRILPFGSPDRSPFAFSCSGVTAAGCARSGSGSGSGAGGRWRRNGRSARGPTGREAGRRRSRRAGRLRDVRGFPQPGRWSGPPRDDRGRRRPVHPRAGAVLPAVPGVQHGLRVDDQQPLPVPLLSRSVLPAPLGARRERVVLRRLCPAAHGDAAPLRQPREPGPARPQSVLDDAGGAQSRE